MVINICNGILELCNTCNNESECNVLIKYHDNTTFIS